MNVMFQFIQLINEQRDMLQFVQFVHEQDVSLLFFESNSDSLSNQWNAPSQSSLKYLFFKSLHTVDVNKNDMFN